MENTAMVALWNKRGFFFRQKFVANHILKQSLFHAVPHVVPKNWDTTFVLLN